MSLSDNLKKIRKEHNLSQEQLAEKIGVSRQAVSKWESGQNYPEMDKMLTICNLFNYNIDELLKEDVKEVKIEKESKKNYNKLIQNILDYIGNVINCIMAMNFKQKIKFLIENLIVIICFIIIYYIIGTLGTFVLQLFVNVFSIILGLYTNTLYEFLYNIFHFFYYTLMFISGTALVIYNIKKRYLDYYLKEKRKQVINKENESEEKVAEEISNNSSNNANDNTRKIEFTNNPFIKEQNTIIFRDKNESVIKNFLKSFIKLIIFGLKCGIAFISIYFIFSFVFFTACTILSFLVFKNTILFIGILLGSIAALTINIVVLKIMYNFIFNIKSNKIKIFMTLIISLLIGGIAIGLLIVGATKFNYINDSELLTKTEEISIPMEENLIIKDRLNYNIEYVESDNQDIKFLIDLTNYNTVNINTYENTYENTLEIVDEEDNINNIEINPEETNSTNTTIIDTNPAKEYKVVNFDIYVPNHYDLFKQILKDINNNEIKNYSQHQYTIKAYTTKENIELLKYNQNSQEID